MPGTLIIIAPEGELRVEVSVSAELTALAGAFAAEAAAVNEACRDGLALIANIRFGEASGGEIVHTTSKGSRNGLLHAIRPFVLSKERLYVPTFLNVFKKENRHERAAIWAADFMRNAFLLRHAPFQLSTAAGGLDLEEQWQHYANAYEYHRDEAKRAVVETAFAPMPPMAEFTFWWGANIKVTAILSLHGFAAMLCGVKPEFTLNLQDEPPQA